MQQQRWRGALAALGMLIGLAACSPGDLLGPDAAQGIEGIALLGPQCPVQSENDPCPDLPHRAWVRVWDSSGGLVTRFQTGEDGRFRVGLRPGRYRLDPESGDPFPVVDEQAVDVAEGVYTDIVISFDTGIR